MDPKTFNLDDWLQDAHLPEESCRVFKKGHLIARLTELREQIEDEAEQAKSGQSMSGARKLTELREEYERLAEEVADSALTVYCSAITAQKNRAVRDAVDKVAEEQGLDKRQAGYEFSYYLVAASVVAVAKPGDQRKDVDWSPEEVKRLEQAISPGEFGKIVAAYKKADSGVKEPSVDFLRKSSGTNSGDTGD